MLIIADPGRPLKALVGLVRAAGLEPQVLTYWDHIDEIYADSEGRCRLVAHGRELASTPVIFLGFPTLRTAGHVDKDFIEAEWQAALTACLWCRRGQVANGQLLLEWPAIPALPRPFSAVLRTAGWPIFEDVSPIAPVWLLRSRGITDHCPAEFLPQAEAIGPLIDALDAILKAHSLHFIGIRLEFAVAGPQVRQVEVMLDLLPDPLANFALHHLVGAARQ